MASLFLFSAIVVSSSFMIPCSITSRKCSQLLGSTSVKHLSLNTAKNSISSVEKIIECPGRRPYEKSYIHDLLAAEYSDFERFDMSPGDMYDASEFRQSIFNGYGVQFESFMELSSCIIELEEALQDQPGTVGLQVDDALKGELAESIRSTAAQLMGADSVSDLERIINTTCDKLPVKTMFLPIKRQEEGARKACEGMESCGRPGWEYMITSQMIVTFVIPESADCVIAVSEKAGYIELQTPNGPHDFSTNGVIFGARSPLSNYIAPISETIQTHDGSKSYRVNVLLETIADSENLSDAIYELDIIPTSSIAFDALEKHQNRVGPVEGVVIADGVISDEVVQQLSTSIDSLAAYQEKNNSVDYHPHSNGIVRDLVHPGLYSYVKDVTKLRASVEDVAPCDIKPIVRLGQHNKIDDEEPNVECQEEYEDLVDEDAGDAEDSVELDFWGRRYESSEYQWLPTYFDISEDGKCRIQDYINNLTPRENPVNANVYESLARLFEQSLPYIESVYSYVRSIRPLLRTSDGPVHSRKGDLDDIEIKPYSLKGSQLQVITKIVDYELKPGQSHEGVWHVEGMSHEEVILTALYVLDRDESITGGDLMFKRALFQDEAAVVFGEVPQTRSPLLETYIEEGLTKLGKVNTPKGRLVVFPNSHVHKVAKMINTLPVPSEGEDLQKSKRRIVVFFLVNPHKRIISTREVAPQRDNTMTHDQALDHRLNLMQERKFFKQDWNVREIELCEH